MKLEKEYDELYGDIPFTENERVEYLLSQYNIKHCKLKVYDEINRITKIKWKSLSYVIYLIPKATPRPRTSANGIFYVKGAKDNKKFFERYLINQDIPLITTPTKFHCTTYLPIPSSMNPVEKLLAAMGFIYPASKPDWDNLGKVYCDMIQGLLVYDYSLIIEGISKKSYSIKPLIEIKLSWLEDYDSAYNKKKIIRKVSD